MFRSRRFVLVVLSIILVIGGLALMLRSPITSAMRQRFAAPHAGLAGRQAAPSLTPAAAVTSTSSTASTRAAVSAPLRGLNPEALPRFSDWVERYLAAPRED